MSKEDGLLTDEQAINPKGCGAGTGYACFALTRGGSGFECSMISQPTIAQFAGIRLGWRVNVDPTDNKAWCPLEVLNNSKQE